MTIPLRLLVGSIICSGGIVAGVEAARFEAGPDLGAVVLVVAAFASGLMMVELSDRSAESVTFAIVVAASLLFGGPPAVLCAIAGEAASGLRPPRPKVHRTAYNIAAHALAAAVLGALVNASGVAPGRVALGVAVVIPASLGYFIVSSGLVSVAIALSTAADARSVWVRHFRWLGPHYVALALVGGVLAQAQKVAGVIGVAIFVLPLVMSHYSVAVFIRRTREQVRALREANDRLESANVELTETLASVVDARDLFLYRHSHQASRYAERIARRLALAEHEVQLVRKGALLHDIGKVGIPEAILRKTGPLDDAEREIMNVHAEIGAEIVARAREMAPVAAIVRGHHERFDGGGYPDGLAGEAIPLGARIVCVLEAFDSMISDRPYRPAMPMADALAEIERCSGTQFDPRVVRVFLDVIREVGTAWLSNSAHAGHRTGAELFLPKSLAGRGDHPDDPDGGRARRLRPVG